MGFQHCHPQMHFQALRRLAAVHVADQLQAHIPNYTNIEPVIQISDIRIG